MNVLLNIELLGIIYFLLVCLYSFNSDMLKDLQMIFV